MADQPAPTEAEVHDAAEVLGRWLNGLPLKVDGISVEWSKFIPALSRNGNQPKPGYSSYICAEDMDSEGHGETAGEAFVNSVDWMLHAQRLKENA